jgi:aldehyde dehydrogenase (NAD+)
MIIGVQGNELSSQYVGGRWSRLRGVELVPIINPATEEVLGSTTAGTAADVDGAVNSARTALAGWASRSVAERAQYLREIVRCLEGNSEQIAMAITRDVGTPISESRRLQVAIAIRTFASAADLVGNIAMKQRLGDSVIRREPLGVAACITPWNYPIYQMATKVAPALAAGCTVVAKPSEVAPLGPLALAEAIHEAGLPDGVFNLVVGSGKVIGEALVRHPGVDAVSFTGSTVAGQRVASLASASVKHLSLELGGKSASVVLADADLQAAVIGTVAKCFHHAGQTCAALTRLLVPRESLGAAEDLAINCARLYLPGDPERPETRMGPLISKVQQQGVQALIRIGIQQKAKVLIGGVDQPVDLTRGFFVSPTVFSEVTPDMTIAREEIFGPVLAIIPYSDEQEAIDIANSTDYGLSGAVWSGDEEKALRVASHMRTGSISINGAPTNPDAPFGGFKQSGYGRERGEFGIEEFLTTKAIHGFTA